MASAVGICNMALAHVGASQLITSIDPPDGSAYAGYCATFYPQARQELLNMPNAFSWSKKRVELAEVANPSTIWNYAYAIPNDMLSAKRIIQQPLVWDDPRFWPYTWAVTWDQLQLFNELGTADFQIEGTTLLTNEPEAVLLYTTDVLDTARFSPAFVTALSYLLASFLAGPIVRGRPGAQMAGELRQIATQMARSAAADDANGASQTAEYMPESILVRR